MGRFSLLPLVPGMGTCVEMAPQLTLWAGLHATTHQLPSAGCFAASCFLAVL